MKRFLLASIAVILIATYAFAGPVYWGPTILHRGNVSSVDTWFVTAQNQARDGSVELKGYNSVRIDANVTGDSVSIVCNLACSNDSTWVSGDAITFTKDSYVDEYLQGCADYYVNVDSVSSGDIITIYLTPFNR